MKYRKKILFCIIGFLLFCFFVYLTNHFYILKFSIKSLENGKYGVIDGNITKLYDNIVYNNDSVVCEDITTHGDEITEFINNRYSNHTIYYYNASIDGEITDKTIIEGLEWMKKNGINKVNISLSSKKYSDELQNWILDNKTELTIYASYSNKKNTYDYPAMYEGVIGTSGTDVISFKDYDALYSTNNIVDLKNLKLYKGNSYLSLISMFQN